MKFYVRRGSVQPKAISLLVLASFFLTSVPVAHADFGGTAPTIPNANVFGEEETQKVDGASGAFTQTIPLDIPPGRNGLQPDVSLDYNSQNTSDGIVGYGWSLSIPYIQRLNKIGSQDLYDNNPYFTSSFDGELAVSTTTYSSTTTPATASTTVPTIADTLNASVRSNSGTSDSFSYTVPSGSNQVFFMFLSQGNTGAPSATLNGHALTLVKGACPSGGASCPQPDFIGYLANPSSGTFSYTNGGSSGFTYSVFTVNGADATNPIDAWGNASHTSGAADIETSTTTPNANDLDIDFSVTGNNINGSSHGAGQTEWSNANDSNTNMSWYASYVNGSSTATTKQGMMETWASGAGLYNIDMVAIKPAGASATQTTTASSVYRAKVDDGSFRSYSYSNNIWTMYDKHGTRYTFGSDDTGRQYDTSTGTSTKTYKWMLQEIRDTNGNYVKYGYLRDGNVLYPYVITYTGHGSADGPFTVTFATSTRPDTRISYASGFVASTTKRISEIDASANGSIVHKYLLGYGTGNNSYRSLLTSVQEQGYDDNGVLTSLPATTFAYASSTTQFYTASGATYPQTYVIADTNGDGISDVNDFGINDVSGLGTSNINVDNAGHIDSPTPPDYFHGSSNPPTPREHGFRYIDVNGDGKADAVVGLYNYTTGITSTSTHINTYSTANGYGWVGTSTTSGTIPIFDYDGSGSIHNASTGIFGDVNGDGLPDYEQYLQGDEGPTAYLGNGINWDATSTFTPLYTMPYFQQTSAVSQLVDVNGDGLDDWVVGSDVYLNTGNGWQASPASQWEIPTSTLYQAQASPAVYYDRGVRLVDINGDGLPDLVRAYDGSTSFTSSTAPLPEPGTSFWVMLNTGNGWGALSTTTYAMGPIIQTTAQSGAWNGNFLDQEFGNWYGNGQMDQDVMTSVTNSKGGSTDITYSQSAQYDGSNPDLPTSLLLATQVVTNDGLGNLATTTYSYSGGKLYLASGVRDRKFAGFAVATTTAPDSTSVNFYDQGVTTTVALGEQNDGYAQINHPFRTDVYNVSNNLARRTYNRWDTIAHASSTFVGLGQQMIEDFGSDGSHRDSATTYSYSSTTDDLLTTTQYGEVTGNSDGTFTDTGTDLRKTVISYVASSSVNMSLPIEKTLSDYYSATTSDQKLYYDSLPFGQVGVGNNTREEDWISGTKYASTTKTYNSYGLVATSTDRNGNATSYVYESYNLYPATTTNALLQKTQAYYNYSNGKVKQSIDPNSRLSKTTFDGIGRPTEVDQSNVNTPTSYDTLATYAYTDSTTSPTSIHRADYLAAATTTDTYDYYDGFNRLIQERKSSQTANLYAVFDQAYNGAGLLASTSLPYFSSGTSNTSPTQTQALYTTYTYDPLKRVNKTANAVGNTSNTYYQWKTTTTDPNGNIKDYIKDAFGNLGNVVEHGSSIATTTYTYDTLNNLATTTDALGNVRHFTYDGLSRRLSAQDLHPTSSNTFGTWTYTYDDQGNLTSQTDPKGQTVNRSYDVLNRMLTEDYTGQSGVEVTNTYDICTNGIGYMCTASSTSAKTSNAYDILGRVSTASTTVGGPWYAMSYAYDRQGNIASSTYPDGSIVQYSYGLAGFPNRIQRKPSGGSFSDIISNYDYAPNSKVLNTLFGNNASTTYFYNANGLYRLSNLQTISSSTSIQNFSYTYDAVGNIIQITNIASSTASGTTLYTYDPLNRLVSASASNASSSPYYQAYTYDPLGNLLSLATTLYSASSSTSTPPSIADSLNITPHHSTAVSGQTDAFTYTVPPGGANQILVVFFSKGASATPSATQNGANITFVPNTSNGCNANVGKEFYGYLVAPTSGTFYVDKGDFSSAEYSVFTVNNAVQANPIEAANCIAHTSPGDANMAVSLTATSTNTLLMDWNVTNYNINGGNHGAGQTEWSNLNDSTLGDSVYSSYVVGSSTAHTSQGMSEVWGSSSGLFDMQMIAIDPSGVPIGTPTTNSYTYAGTAGANPDAVTQIGNGISTTTYGYDNNGNLIQSILSSAGKATTTLYTWDYANRLIETDIGATSTGTTTTTYGYDASGNRVYQKTATSTTLYPFKWVSIASSTGSGAQYSTTTDYAWNGDTLLATIDQQFASGNATGTAQTHYIHPDHLGSTNTVTDASGIVTQTLDYFPYGATRVNTTNGNYSGAGRQYVNRFADQNSIDYLTNRYYDSSRGQFISQDPVFWSQEQDLSDPQSLDSYSYANDNPITGKDPDGKFSAQGYTQGVIQGITAQAIAIAQLVLALSTQPTQTTMAIANSIASLAQNPQAIGQSISNAASSYAAASDYEQSRLSGYYGSYIMTAALSGVASRVATVSGGGAASIDAMTAVRSGVSGEGSSWSTAYSAGKVLWPGGENGSQVINGVKYSDHALDQMAPAEYGGRGVPPSAVKSTIENGTKSQSYNNRTVYEYNNVRVVTESDGTVVTVVKTGH